MRIQGGSLRGRKIKAPSAKDIRPTSQMIKEALFDILGDKIHGARFLDLFAGFGTIGIEAVSRNAESVVFVDKNKYALSIIRENLYNIGLNSLCKTINSEAIKAIKERLSDSFDVIFIDPPYNYEYYDEVIRGIFEKRILKPDGLIIIEHYHKTKLTSEVFEILKIRKYGQTTLTFLKNHTQEV